ncbi:MAG: hypothetical protein U0667_08380 [Chloroflexota bacterium]
MTRTTRGRRGGTAGTVRALWPHGITGTLVTTCTQSEAHISAAVRAVADARRGPARRGVGGASTS